MADQKGLAAAAFCVGMFAIFGCQGPGSDFALPNSSGAQNELGTTDTASSNPLRFRIDDSVKPIEPSLEPLEDGQARPVGAFVAPDGVREEFVVNEVILHPESQAELDAFLARYNGVVLRDGTLDAPPDVEQIESVEPSGYYLIRIDPQTSSTDDLDDNLLALGVEGGVGISSADAARLSALLLRERSSHHLSPNLVFTPSAVLEHPKQVGNFDAEDFRWMSEGFSGYSVGVIHAWEYMKYWNVPATPDDNETVMQNLQRVAVIDRGFALDETTGRPLNDNPDFFYFGNNGPFQYNFSKNKERAGGDGWDWHGTKAFGVCCAKENNHFGTAGTGAPVTIPVLLRGEGLYGIADAIRYAAIWYGADVISLSLSIDCGLLCDAVDGGDQLQNAVYTAIAFDAVVVAGAANDGIDISDKDVYPCKLDSVICVGSVFQGGPSGDITLRYNYGDGVDIWAPTSVYTTVSPDRAALDDNDFGEDEIKEFGGTSASTPFVAGIVALMRAMDPTLRWDDIQQILQDTSNKADDPRVTHGYVDAYKAVRAIRPNQPPTVEFLFPADGATMSYSNVRFRAKASDPEPNARVENLGVVFSSEDGAFAPCVARIRYDNGDPVFECQTALDFGFNQVHDVRVSAFDPHGGNAVDRISINVVNTPPSIKIVDPVDGAMLFEHLPNELAAYPQDNEEHPFPQDQVSWTSDVDGDLGTTGWKVTPKLSKGTHVITATATDETGLTASDSITVRVVSGAGIPTAMITDPDVTSSDPNNGSLALPGDPVKLAAFGSDPEDGPLPDSAFEWYSDHDGFLGTGQSINVVLSGPARPCHPEFRVHEISLIVTDSDSNNITLTARVSVGVVC